MDDQRDAETESIKSGSRHEETPMYGAGAPTEQVDRSDQISSRPQPGSHAGSTPASAKTEVLKREPPTFAWVVVAQGRQKGEIFQLSTNTTAIGRDGTNAIRLDDRYVSRSHARIRAEEDADGALQFILYDQASTGGVFVNHEQVYRHQLQDGDRLTIGETVLIFKRPRRLVMEEGNG
jgi:pSer/pThr/pTyr-binding forkhead associated (FHA) protein